MEKAVFPNSEDFEEYGLMVNYSMSVFWEYKLSCQRDDSFYKKELTQIKKRKTLVIKSLLRKLYWFEATITPWTGMAWTIMPKGEL